MVVMEAQSSSPSPPCLVELPLLVNMSTALEFLLLTALGNLCMEAPMETGGSSSERTEVWLASLLNVLVLSLTEMACASSKLVEEGRLSN